MAYLVTLALSATAQTQEKFEALASNWASNQASHCYVPLLQTALTQRSQLEEMIDKIQAHVGSLKLSVEGYPVRVTFSAIHNVDVHRVKLVASSISDSLLQIRSHFSSYFPDPQVVVHDFKPRLYLYEGEQAAHVFDSLTNNSPTERNARSFIFEGDGVEVLIQHQKSIAPVVVTKFVFNSQWGFRGVNYVNGEWASPHKGKYMPVFNPATGESFHRVAASTSQDIDLAVAAAKSAFPLWSETPAATRAHYLQAIAARVEQKKEFLASLETLDNGKSIVEAEVDINDVAACFRYYADRIIELEKTQNQVIDVGDTSISASVRYEPLGVAGLIVPWNYPLLMAAWKVAPALASGCTCVLKPSELTPLSALELAAIADSVGLPAGVFNVVLGTGSDAGQPLAAHPDIGKVAFTGSVTTGSKIASVGAKTIKKVSLELGGKSPLIVCRDADLDQACDWILAGIFLNSGQICSATSRVLMHSSIASKLLEKIRTHVKTISVGDGLNRDHNMGPVVSEGQYTKVMYYINSGLAQGATLFYGGTRPANAPPGGYFLLPTIFVDVKPFMRIWQEEIFGPVLSVMTFENEDEAIDLANDTQYGLGGAVFSRDEETAQRIARKLRCGIVWINCSQPTFVQLPWGGYKKSGTGRELGPWGLFNYLEVKQVTNWVNQSEKGWGWFMKSNL
jgi:betaine-aldehyde dehydrogenase